MAAVSRLPSVHAIRVFEVAARHLSFTRAAQELGMTQAAVSYQIRILEEAVGVPLFRRASRRVTLTPVGERLAPAVGEAFSTLRRAFGEVIERSESELAITALPTIAATWLAARLGAFQLAHPKLAVRLETSRTVVDFAEEPYDIGLRHGRGRWPGLESDLILRDRFQPLCTPAFAARARLRQPRDLLKAPRLGDPARWKVWLARAGVTGDVDYGGVRLDLHDVEQLEVAAAMAGHGVALATTALFRRELEQKQLVAPFDVSAGDGRDYWLVYPTARRQQPKIVVFRAWLLAEARASLRG